MSLDDLTTQELHRLAASPAPRTLAQLNRRFTAVAEALHIPEQRARRLLAALIVAQALPPGVVVKGGIGIKVRLGELGTRATSDLDLATQDRERAVAALAERLAAGWGQASPTRQQLAADPQTPPRTAFFADLRASRQATPAGLSSHYVMAPYRATVYFLTARNPVASVLVEIASDEFNGLTLAPADDALSPQAAAMLAALGCGPARPVQVISIEQQIAQKLHAASDPAENRGHDLVDLQLLWNLAGQDGGPDLRLLSELCRRTFAFRSPSRDVAGRVPHAWPPSTEHLRNLGDSYRTALEQTGAGLPCVPPHLAPDVDVARRWLDGIILEIDEHGSAGGTPPTHT